jgi:hypothetical protein
VELAVLLSCGGCALVPVPVSSKTKDVSCQFLQLDLTFLKAGLTTREEVTKNLGVIDTQVNRPNFFWDRWESSTWGVVGVIRVPVGGERVWGARNLLTEFNSQGTVKSWNRPGRKLQESLHFPERGLAVRQAWGYCLCFFLQLRAL